MSDFLLKEDGEQILQETTEGITTIAVLAPPQAPQRLAFKDNRPTASAYRAQSRRRDD